MTKANKRKHPPQARHDRVDLPSDSAHVVHAREERLQPSTGRRHQTTCVVQQGSAPAVAGNSWLPVEDTEIGLDPDDSWYDEAVDREYKQEVEEPDDHPHVMKKHSLTSVCFVATTGSYVTYLLYSADQWYYGRSNTGINTWMSC